MSIHQISCMLNDQYLGRAQQCITQGTARYMCWKPTHEWNNISPREEHDFEHLQREGWELACIRNANTNTVVEAKADNDNYSNPVRRLPRTLHNDDFPVQVTLYNFKFNPPRTTQTVLKRDEFRDTSPRVAPAAPCKKLSWIKSPRDSARPEVLEELNTLDRFLNVSGVLRLRILYRVSEDEERVHIEYVKLHIGNYETTLNFV